MGRQSKLIDLRKTNNITQVELANILNINVASYINKELGKTDFKLSEAIKISKIFKKSLDEIFLQN